VGVNFEKEHPMSGVTSAGKLTAGMNAPGNYQIVMRGVRGKEAGMDAYYLLRTGGETSKLSKPQFASNARPGRELRSQRWASTGLSKSAERRTRGPSPHHHINVHVLQEAIQIITNDVWLNPISQSDGLWK